MKDIIEINGKKIGEGQDVFVIAEIGINHNGNFNMAKKLIDEAKISGADAVKMQTYITEKRVSKDSPIFEILKQCELNFDQEKELFQYARDKAITIFSTPFDEESVDFLYSVDAPCYKIASFDIVNTKLLRKVASKGKPVIISRGMANREEIDKAVGIMEEFKVDVALLHCISSYPVTSLSSLHLSTIQALRERYHCPVGFSDHTLGIEAARYAVFAGAKIIEKHFTLSRKQNGPDHVLSMEPKEIKKMIKEIRSASEMMGNVAWSLVPAEKEIFQYRRVS